MMNVSQTEGGSWYCKKELNISNNKLISQQLNFQFNTFSRRCQNEALKVAPLHQNGNRVAILRRKQLEKSIKLHRMAPQRAEWN